MRTLIPNDVATYQLCAVMSDGTLRLLPPGCTKGAVGLADPTVATLDNQGVIIDPNYTFALTAVKPKSITDIRPLMIKLPDGTQLTLDQNPVNQEQIIVGQVQQPPGVPPHPVGLRALIVL